MNWNERAHGLMIGLATGNLLGIPMEGGSKESIAAEYPDGVREIGPESEGADDDDLAQAIIIARAAARGPLDPDDLGRRLWAWAETNGRGIGLLTLDVLTLYGGAPPRCPGSAGSDGQVRIPAGIPIIEASRTASGGTRAGNGALMRSAPIAIRWRDDPAALVRNSIVGAVPTHWDPRCGWSCAALNLAAASALRAERISPDALLDAALEGVRASLPELRPYGYEGAIPETVRDTVREAADTGIADLILDQGSIGFTLRALKVGLTAYWRASSFESTLSAIVEAGGDTDTNGAIAGAIRGARLGSSAIPPRWRDRIAEIRAGRTSLEELADRLVGMAGT